MSKTESDFDKFLVSKPQPRTVNWVVVVIRTYYDREYNSSRFEHKVYAFTDQEDLLEFCVYCHDNSRTFYVTKNIPVPITIRKEAVVG